METINFRIGEGFGELIQDLAQEKLLFNWDLVEAMKVLKDTGIPSEYHLDLLLGVTTLGTDIESQTVFISDTQKLIPLKETINRKQAEFSSCNETLISTFKNLSYSKDYKFFKYFTWEEVLDIAYDRYDIETLYEEDAVYNIRLLVETTRRCIKEQTKFYSLFKPLSKLIQEKYFVEFGYISISEEEELDALVSLFKAVIDKDLEVLKSSDLPELNSYLKTSLEISSIEKLEPTDELKDAGWLSPKGDYYGLNGEIANMLHNQIADFLIEQGIIPEEYSNNADEYLNEQGWIRQHRDWILSDAYYYDKEVTTEQIEKLVKLTVGKHRTLYLGVNRYEVTPAMLKMIDPIQFKMKFFKL